MEKENKLEKIYDINGNEHIIAIECEISGRKFYITTERKIFEKKIDETYKECTEEDEVTKFLAKYTKPSKSLDIEY